MTRFYIDESGQSGADLYEPEQPILSCVGVFLNEEQEGLLTAFLGGLRSTHRLQDKGELKSKLLLGSGKGLDALRALLDFIKTSRIALCAVVAHKTSFAAGALVEDCADHAFNPRFGPEWTWPHGLKERLVEAILKAADPKLLQATWRARGGSDLQTFESTHRSLLTQLSLHRDPSWRPWPGTCWRRTGASSGKWSRRPTR